jgi:alkaline phosphatase D
MSEFVGTSVTSESFMTTLFQSLLPENPHIKLIDDSVRGYVLCDVMPQTWRTTLRMVDNVRVREPTFRTRASFVVENGRPGVESA